MDRTSRCESRPPHPLAVQVQRGAIEVSGRILHIRHSVPALPYLQEGFLHHVFRLEAVPGEETEGTEQVRALGLHQGF